MYFSMKYNVAFSLHVCLCEFICVCVCAFVCVRVLYFACVSVPPTWPPSGPAAASASPPSGSEWSAKPGHTSSSEGCRAACAWGPSLWEPDRKRCKKPKEVKTREGID